MKIAIIAIKDAQIAKFKIRMMLRLKILWKSFPILIKWK